MAFIGDQVESKFVLVGGANHEEHFGDVWVVSVEEEKKNTSIQDAEPSQREKVTFQKLEFEGAGDEAQEKAFESKGGMSAVALDKKQILLFGGEERQGNLSKDFFELNLETQKMKFIDIKLPEG